jgi:hypothetical protein
VYILVADQPALLPDTTPPGVYRPRGTSSLQRLFRFHFPQITARYEPDFAKRLGPFPLKRLTSAVERFLDCGDYTKGIARIRCTKAGCKTEYFRPFSCKVFHLCPSCSQKRRSGRCTSASTRTSTSCSASRIARSCSPSPRSCGCSSAWTAGCSARCWAAAGQPGSALHDCGTFDRYAAQYQEVGKLASIEIEMDSDIRAAMEAFPNAATIASIMDPYLMLRASATQVAARVRSGLDAARGQWTRFSLSVPDIENGTPDENIAAVVETVRSATEAAPARGHPPGA